MLYNYSVTFDVSKSKMDPISTNYSLILMINVKLNPKAVQFVNSKRGFVFVMVINYDGDCCM